MKRTIIFLGICLIVWAPSFAQQKKGPKGKKKTTTESVVAPPVVEETPPPPPVSDIVPANFDSAGYNTLSVRLVHKSDIMYRMSLWRKLDLKEKCNQPFFAKDSWISKLIIEGVATGQLQAYRSDSLTRTMTKDQFMEKIKEQSGDDGGAGEIDPFTGQKIVSVATASFFQPKALNLLVLKEDLLFDKQRSRHYYDIQTVTMVLPSELNIKGTESDIATFKYKDLIRYFASNPNAKWYNGQNRAEDKALSHAFDLRLFCSRIIKMSNPGDQMLQDISAYNQNNKSLLIASLKLEHELVNKENELWDY